MPILDELKRYSPALTIFSAFMVAGSFMGTMEQSEYTAVGLVLFFSGFLGIFWCLIDAIKMYWLHHPSSKWRGKSIAIEILNVLSIALLATIGTAIIFVFYFLGVLSITVRSPFSLIIQFYGLIFIYVLFSAIMLRYYFVLAIVEIKRVISEKLKKKKRAKSKKRT